MENINETKSALIGAIEPVLKDSFMDLVDIEVLRGRYIRVIIDKMGGKTGIEACTFISKKIEEFVNIEEIVSGSYSLEVSSAGIDRPLRKKEDFQRFIGGRAKIITREPIEGRNVFTGTLSGTDGENIIINDLGRSINIGFGLIKKANLEPETFGRK